MGIPAIARLRCEMHCLSHDGLVVLTAQRWSDPAAPAGRPRSWLRLVRNGVVRDERLFSGVKSHLDMDARWARIAEWYAPTLLTEEQMWRRLYDLVGVDQLQCQRGDCAGRMPVGWPRCPDCGRDARRVASGSLSGVRSRGVIMTRGGAGPTVDLMCATQAFDQS